MPANMEFPIHYINLTLPVSANVRAYKTQFTYEDETDITIKLIIDGNYTMMMDPDYKA